MTSAGRGEVWTGTQLAARLVAMNGVPPKPMQHIIFRSTSYVDGRVVEGHEVPGEKRRLNEPALDFWLARHGLAGGERLAVAVLVIRETLDDHGQIRLCTLERRRGSPDGPFHGDPARVEFTGAAGSVRLYRARADGGLSEVTPSSESAPPRVRSAERFAGEQQALQARFGEAVEILDVREPTLLEDIVGLSSIVHLRTEDGREAGCGIGWHGNMPFVLEAEFPRFGAPLTLLPDDSEAIDAAVKANDLVRGETRLDEQGLAVVARRRDGPELFLLYPDASQVRLEPYTPGRGTAGTDQQRWMRYAETYERLKILDVYHDGNTANVIVLTGDPGGKVWRHHIDSDGVETWRKLDDEAAIGVVHREQLLPGTLAALDVDPPQEVAPGAPRHAGPSRTATDDSLLGKIEAYGRVISALHEAQEAAAATEGAAPSAGTYPDGWIEALRELEAALVVLETHVTAASVHGMVIETLEGGLRPGAAADALAQIDVRLRRELASLRLVIVTPARAHLLDHDQPPFGTAVTEGIPSASYDIEEAVHCLALRRPTAAVFHCLNVLQHGIGAFAQRVGVADPVAKGELRWRQILQVFRATDEKSYGEVSGALGSVRKRWRSASLRLAGRYTEEEAELIVQVVGKFMRALAKVCNEHGRH